jgi:type VI secretion system protein ImpF
MARTELDRAVQPSLLDRLTDDAPRELSDHATTRDASARLFRGSVQRDVEALLNTRRTMVRPTEEQVEVTHSVHQYGLPDMTGYSLSAFTGRQRLTEEILDTLRRFEPRLTNIQVNLSNQKEGQVSQVRFSIAATLLMDPSPEQVMFDTVLEVATGVYAVDAKS